MRLIFSILMSLFSFAAIASTQGQGTLSFAGHEASKKQLDLVFVIDNSGSMTYYKDHLIEQITKTLKSLENNVDYKVAFIDSDFEALDFVGLDQEITDSAIIASLLVNFLHLNAHFEERPLDTTLALLSKYNDFKRTNSDLVVINMTNEDDQSQISTQAYLANLMTLFKSPIHHILISDKSGTNCAQTPIATLDRLTSLLLDSNLQHFSLCQNFADNLQKALSHKIRLDLGIKLPVNHQAKLFVDGIEISEFELSSDRSALYFETKTKISIDSEIIVNFNI